MSNSEIKRKAIMIRKQGKTYHEIAKILSKSIPKGTLSGWLSGIELSAKAKERLRMNSKKHLEKARIAALAASKKKRDQYLASVEKRCRWVAGVVQQEHTAKIALAMLYLGEGKKQSGSVSFGNSNPNVIRIFLGLLRSCYQVNETKFRATVQCRADQSSETLQQFWIGVTGFPVSQFYHAQVDKRSIGAATKKMGYKGVCRIDYFSADVFNELRTISEMVAQIVSSIPA